MGQTYLGGGASASVKRLVTTHLISAFSCVSDGSPSADVVDATSPVPASASVMGVAMAVNGPSQLTANVTGIGIVVSRRMVFEGRNDVQAYNIEPVSIRDPWPVLKTPGGARPR